VLYSLVTLLKPRLTPPFFFYLIHERHSLSLLNRSPFAPSHQVESLRRRERVWEAERAEWLAWEAVVEASGAAVGANRLSGLRNAAGAGAATSGGSSSSAGGQGDGTGSGGAGTGDALALAAAEAACDGLRRENAVLLERVEGLMK